MKALLVRVGVDHAYGGWNAPVDPTTGQFLYVPIPEKTGTPFHRGLERKYEEVLPSLHEYCQRHDAGTSDLRWPEELLNCPMHLDPDFQHLTYGDDGGRRGAGMREMTRGDLLVFYAGLRPIIACQDKLVYALVGLYIVEEVVHVDEVPEQRWLENAHTRKSKRGKTDIVVRAQRGVSGRLERCIPIGEWRSGAYRVRNDVLRAWGGLSVKDGFIQRSAVPPSFLDPERFYPWFKAHNIALLDRNN